MKWIILTSVLLTITLSQSFCNRFPLDSKSCIEKTTGMCQFSLFENACIPVQQTNLGCVRSLNRQACLQQLTNRENEEAFCFFRSRCIQARPQHFRQLGCHEGFSKNACLSVQGLPCAWFNDKCQQIEQIASSTQTNCKSVYKLPVVPWLCGAITHLRCRSSGFTGGYECVDVADQELSVAKCTNNGLSMQACVMISTPGQKCIFLNNLCQEYTTKTTDTCTLKVNKEACLTINATGQVCEWTIQGCKRIEKNQLQCDDLVNVNPNACLQASGLCIYNANTKSCFIPTDIQQLTCDTFGINEQICMSLNQTCTYFYGKCSSLKEADFNIFNCDMRLNKNSCLKITTEYQYCQWNGTKCLSLTINQDTSCTDLANINGNVCRAVIKDSCTYDAVNFKCVASQVNNLCTTPYLNLKGCVSISLNSQRCQWFQNRCRSISIVRFQTKCNELGYANPVACSQIVQTRDNGLQIGCYFNQITLKCEQFEENPTLTCLTVGLNSGGCTLITKKNERCRWFRGQCLQISQKSDVSTSYCLSVKDVNAAVCAMVEIEPCKFNPFASSCVSSVNGNTDSCNTQGLNNKGCAMIQREGQNCLYDTVNWVCNNLDLTEDPEDGFSEAVRLQLDKASCSENSPTIQVCSAITRVLQQCSWTFRLSKCMNQVVFLNDSCFDYNQAYQRLKRLDNSIQITVNANVCAAIEMNYPYDGGKDAENKLIDEDRGFCIFDDASNNCKVYKTTDEPITTCELPCCKNMIGINTHVCSRYSNQEVYCYFSTNKRCTELTSDDVDLNTESLVGLYFNENKISCANVNKKACHLIDWSTKQWCYYDGKACINVDFKNFLNLKVFSDPPAITNRYLCLAIEGITITGVNTEKYFEYSVADKRCKIIPTSAELTCSQENINQNACAKFTKQDYCQWDRISLTCNYLEDINQVNSCNSLINEKACLDMNLPCIFLNTTDKCETVLNTNVACTFFDAIGKVSATACSSITKDGETCSYDAATKLCKKFEIKSDTCEVQGANANACYNFTSLDCRWDPQAFRCYEELDKVKLMTLGCNDFVNKTICLKLTTETCEWDVAKMKCIKMTNLSSASFLPANQYNAKACASATGGGRIFVKNKFSCIAPTSEQMPCNSAVMNLEACMSKTKGFKCMFDKDLPPETMCQFFSGTQENCVSTKNISLEICSSVPKTCKYNKALWKCEDAFIPDTTKCSSLAADTANYYNVKSCISISDQLLDTGTETICKTISTTQVCSFEKYCQWNPTTYTCSLLPVGESELYKVTVQQACTDSEGNPTTCSVQVDACRSKLIAYAECSVYYSKAVCHQLVTEECYFDVNQGGCINMDQNEEKPLTCASANSAACIMITNSSLNCQVDSTSTTDLTAQCDVDANNKKCAPIQASLITNKTCADLSAYSSINPTICAQATDACHFDGTKCATIAGTPACNTLGLSRTSCSTSLCDFTTICKYKPGTSPPTGCDAVDAASGDAAKKCASVDAPCQFKTSPSNSCQTAQATCSGLGSDIVSLKACLLCTGDVMRYSPTKAKCEKVDKKVSSCTNLNQQACLTQTSKLYCRWIQNSCKTIGLEEAVQSTDCVQFNKDSCSFVNSNCWLEADYCKASDKTKSCTDVGTNLGNLIACTQAQAGQCYWTNGKCANNLASQNPKTFDCEELGLNYLSCTQATGSTATPSMCYFDGKCQSYIPSQHISIECVNLNYYACLNATSKKCGWKVTSMVCGEIKFIPIPICGVFQDLGLQNGIKYDLVNAKTCASIPRQFQEDDKSCRLVDNDCKLFTNPKPCNEPGLSEYYCHAYTVGSCMFQNLMCQVTNSKTIGCSNQLNSQACTNQNDKCQFIIPERRCTAYNPVINMFNDVNFRFSPKVCADNQENRGVSLDVGTWRCQQLNLRDQTCLTLGLNRRGCLSNTKQLCQHLNGVCQSVSRSSLSNFKTCDQNVSWLTCINLSVPGGCKFVNNVCTSVLLTDTCLSLVTSLALVSKSICATRTDRACKHNSIEYRCEQVVETNLICPTQGLNKIGCIANTDGICFFNDNTGICQIYLKKDITCASPISKKLCYSVSMPNNFCIFQNSRCTGISPTLLPTCVTNLETNQLTCSKATNTACSYDQAQYKCVSGPPTKECVGNKSINMLACVACEVNDKKLIWKDDSCLELEEADFAKLLCSDAVNRLACINISNPSQFCRFLNGRCQSVNYKAIQPCLDITNINRAEFCESPTNIACNFDSVNRKCIQQAGVIDDCNVRGPNRLACLAKASCLFGNNCYDQTQIQQCSQATNQATCIGITNDFCKFDQGACIRLENPTDLSCKDLETQQLKVSVPVCGQAKPTNEIDACVRDSTMFSCRVIQPARCEELESQQSCIRIPNIPCIWQNNRCEYYSVVQDVDTCVVVNLIGSERVCLDILRFGYYCQFKDFACLTAPLELTCTSNLNRASCLIQYQKSCIWKTVTKQVQKVKDGPITLYQSGSCSAYISDQSQRCEDVLSYLACFEVLRYGSQCMWFDNRCLQITNIPKVVTLSTYSLINANTCGLVTEVEAEYDNVLKRCRLASENRICTTPGLNRLACISIKIDECTWNDQLKYCSKFVRNSNRLLAGQKPTCEQNTTQQITANFCRTITGFIECQFSNGQCISLLSTAKCEDQGVNYFGCMSIKIAPCQWINGQCQEYYPVGLCAEVPVNVNEKVCQLVEEDACSFDNVQFKCNPIGNTIKNLPCTHPGLNGIACAYQDGCMFENERCLKPTSNILCSQAAMANEKVCALAIDRCKYLDFMYGCTQSSSLDSCSQKGISSLGCNVLNDCVMNDSTCQCKQFLEEWPECPTITTYQRCASLNYCFFQLTSISSSQDLTAFLQQSNSGTCRRKVCSDVNTNDCDSTSIDEVKCYLNQNRQCNSAKSCDEIKAPISDCINHRINGRPCQNVGRNCGVLTCLGLDRNDCENRFKDYCYFKADGTCSLRQCDQMVYQLCVQNQCDWNLASKSCSYQKKCDEIFEAKQCMVKSQLDRQCGWITNENGVEVCRVNSCRYMGVTQAQCIGTQIGNEVCVQMNDFSCVSCEEITDVCICYSQKHYCQYDRLNNKCKSKTCAQKAKEHCTNDCRYSEENQVCEPFCNVVYNQLVCESLKDCLWDQNNRLCQYYKIDDRAIKFIIPNPSHEDIIHALLMLIIVGIF